MSLCSKTFSQILSQLACSLLLPCFFLALQVENTAKYEDKQPAKMSGMHESISLKIIQWSDVHLLVFIHYVVFRQNVYTFFVLETVRVAFAIDVQVVPFSDTK